MSIQLYLIIIYNTSLKHIVNILVLYINFEKCACEYASFVLPFLKRRALRRQARNESAQSLTPAGTDAESHASLETITSVPPESE